MIIVNLLKRFFNNRGNLYLLLIVIVGAYLRLYQLEQRTGFDADQEELAFKAKELLSGDPVLLGPKTSVGGFSIAPAFTYLWAIFSFVLRGAPVSGAYLSVFLGILTVLIFYFIGKEVFNRKTGLFLAGLSAFSFNLITWDQNPWAPSLFYLSQIILLYGAYLSTRKEWGIVFVALGAALGINSHFAIFISFLGIIVYWVFNRPILKNKKFVLYALGIAFLSYLPPLLYDLKNNFVNLKRLFGVFVGSPEGTSASVAKIFKSLYYSTASVIYPYPDEGLAKVIFLGVIIFAVWKLLTDKKFKTLIVLFLLSIVLPGMVFVFWRQNFSEYYLMSAIPSFILLVGYTFFKYKGEKDFLWAVIVFFLLMNIISWMEYKRPLNLDAKMNAVEYILSKTSSKNFGVSLSVDDGYQFGYKYIFSSHGVEPDIPPLKDQKEIYTIVVPPGWKGIQAKVEFDGVGVLW